MSPMTIRIRPSTIKNTIHTATSGSAASDSASLIFIFFVSSKLRPALQQPANEHDGCKEREKPK